MKDEHDEHDNASRRQDVVLDARDVDVAVRAVALHGEELEVPPNSVA